MGLPLKEARRIIRIKSETVSLDSPIGEEGEGCLADLVEDRHIPGPLEETMHRCLPFRCDRALNGWIVVSDVIASVGSQLRLGLHPMAGSCISSII